MSHNSLPVPHWATAMVGNYRRQCNVRPEITDAQVWWLLEDCRGLEQVDIEQCVREELGTEGA